MTTAAERFLESVSVAWDHLDCWLQTAHRGLSETDEGALQALCRETGDDYEAAEAEVLAVVRRKVADAL